MNFLDTWDTLNALTERWITGDDPSYEKVWVTRSKVEFKNFILAAAERKDQLGYRLIVKDGLYVAANPQDLNHCLMMELLHSQGYATNDTENYIIGFPTVIDFETDNFEIQSAFSEYISDIEEFKYLYDVNEPLPEGMTYNEFVRWYNKFLKRTFNSHNQIAVGNGFEVKLYIKRFGSVDEFKTKTALGRALADEIKEIKEDI